MLRCLASGSVATLVFFFVSFFSFTELHNSRYNLFICFWWHKSEHNNFAEYIGMPLSIARHDFSGNTWHVYGYDCWCSLCVYNIYSTSNNSRECMPLLAYLYSLSITVLTLTSDSFISLFLSPEFIWCDDVHNEDKCQVTVCTSIIHTSWLPILVVPIVNNMYELKYLGRK